METQHEGMSSWHERLQVVNALHVPCRWHPATPSPLPPLLTLTCGILQALQQPPRLLLALPAASRCLLCALRLRQLLLHPLHCLAPVGQQQQLAALLIHGLRAGWERESGVCRPGGCTLLLWQAAPACNN